MCEREFVERESVCVRRRERETVRLHNKERETLLLSLTYFPPTTACSEEPSVVVQKILFAWSDMCSHRQRDQRTHVLYNLYGSADQLFSSVNESVPGPV